MLSLLTLLGAGASPWKDPDTGMAEEVEAVGAAGAGATHGVRKLSLQHALNLGFGY